MTEVTLQIFDDHVIRKDAILLDLYRDFLSDIETRIEQLRMAQLICKASKFVSPGKSNPGNLSNFHLASERNIFIDKIQERLFKDEQACLLCDLMKVQNLLDQNVFDESIAILTEAEKKLNKMASKEAATYSWFFYTRSLYHQKRGSHDDYYKDSLKYLVYTPESHFAQEEKVELCVSIALAILLSEKLYNFSELIELPLLTSLKDSNQEWVYALVNSFNEGNVAKFHDVAKKYQQQIQSHVRHPRCQTNSFSQVLLQRESS